jgi:hypothetical protein
MISDFRNAAHFLSTNTASRFIIPGDAKARRDISRYLSVFDVSDLDIKLHEELDSEKEMVQCFYLGMIPEGREALTTFGTLACAHLRERSSMEVDPPRELLVWLALQTTGVHQRVQPDFNLIYQDMKTKDKMLGAQRRFPNSRALRAWIQSHGHAHNLSEIHKRLALPRYNLGRETRRRQEPLVGLIGQTSSVQAATAALNATNNQPIFMDGRRLRGYRYVMRTTPRETGQPSEKKTEDPTGPEQNITTRGETSNPENFKTATPTTPTLPCNLSSLYQQARRMSHTNQSSAQQHTALKTSRDEDTPKPQDHPRPPTASPVMEAKPAGFQPFVIPEAEPHIMEAEPTDTALGDAPTTFYLPSNPDPSPPQAHASSLILAISDTGEACQALDLVVRFSTPRTSTP